MKAQTLHGLLVIDKPGGMTSRDAVNRVQRLLPRGTRIGHTGTLDPLATGVLVLCIGAATRLAEYVQDMSKTYRAGLLLGVRSDTEDADGTVTPVEGAIAPDLATVGEALQSFVGEIEQVPPDFSAAKVSGRRAYDLARRGQDVMLSARAVKVYGIEVVSYIYPRLEIAVHCGKGTYIRSLARDLGDKLGCGALIETLRRTRVGGFKVEDAVIMDAAAETMRHSLRPLAEAVAELPRAVVTQDTSEDLWQGRSLLPAALEPSLSSRPPVCAAFGHDGKLVAVLTWRKAEGKWKPHKVMATAAG